jgi:DNA invertase Pin-like site-specific DNA recombinase
MCSVIYNRVSSHGQNAYGKTVSLAMQESICNKFASDNKLRVNQITKEIRSASGTSSKLLNKLIDNTRTNNIIFMDVSRFSRNVTQGLLTANKAINNGIKLIFVHEKFACTTYADLPKMKCLINKTEEESKVIGVRITTARNHMKAQGLHPGGIVPFGYTLKKCDIGNRLIPNEYEQQIVAFIKICQSNCIRSNILNDAMKKLVSQIMLKNYVNIDCYDNNGDRVLMIDKMDNISIADLLNEYEITKRGKSWKSSTVKTAMNSESYVSYKPILDTPIDDTDNQSFNFQSFTSTLTDIEGTAVNKKKSKTRRSQRLHNISDSDELNSPVQPRRRMSLNSTIRSEILSDIELFAEFKSFKKMVNSKK